MTYNAKISGSRSAEYHGNFFNRSCSWCGAIEGGVYDSYDSDAEVTVGVRRGYAATACTTVIETRHNAVNKTHQPSQYPHTPLPPLMASIDRSTRVSDFICIISLRHWCVTVLKLLMDAADVNLEVRTARLCKHVWTIRMCQNTSRGRQITYRVSYSVSVDCDSNYQVCWIAETSPTAWSVTCSKRDVNLYCICALVSESYLFSRICGAVLTA